MGLKDGAKTLHSITGLTIEDVFKMCKGLADEYGMDTPTMDVDCSNVCFKVGKTVPSVASLLMANAGFCVVPVCDANVRPISKQATHKRKADREKNQIKAALIRKELRSLRSRVYTDAVNRQEIMKQIVQLERNCKSAETASDNVVSEYLSDLLIVELEQSAAHTKNNAHGFVANVMIAEFQADAVMMGHSVNRQSLMAMTSDADIPCLSGDCCIAVKDFTTDGKIQLVCTSETTLKNAMEYLSEDAEKRITYTPAKHPIFENVSDMKVRAVMVLFLGCDVYVKGLLGAGAKTLDDTISINYPAFTKQCPHASLLAYLKKYLYTKIDSFDNDTVHTYIRALLYEPTNMADSPRTYLGGVPPTKLPAYLKEFAHESQKFSTVQLSHCARVWDAPHINFYRLMDTEFATCAMRWFACIVKTRSEIQYIVLPVTPKNLLFRFVVIERACQL